MMLGSLNCREKMILKVAEKLRDLPIESLDEAIIDSNFLFRFDPLWTSKVRYLRSVVWFFMGETTNIQPFNRENQLHLQWEIHLEMNKNVTVGVDLSKGLTISNGHRQGYSPFNKELTATLMSPDSKLDEEKAWSAIWQEASQISQFHSELNRIGMVFDVIPSETEFNDYSPKQIRTFYNNVFDWVMWGLHVPTFRWEMSQFIENKYDSKVRCSIRPSWWPDGHWQNLEGGGRIRIPHELGNTKRMTLLVRIRTWTIYYFTKRGGGIRTENNAVDIWNDDYQDIKPKHFRNERARLLKNGSKKNAQLSLPYLGLTAW